MTKMSERKFKNEVRSVNNFFFFFFFFEEKGLGRRDWKKEKEFLNGALIFFKSGTAILGALKKRQGDSGNDVDYHFLAGAMASYGGGRKPYLVCCFFFSFLFFSCLFFFFSFVFVLFC